MKFQRHWLSDRRWIRQPSPASIPVVVSYHPNPREHPQLKMLAESLLIVYKSGWITSNVKNNFRKTLIFFFFVNMKAIL